MAHLRPFQRSASVSVFPEASASKPTAVHRLADEHEIPASGSVPLIGWLAHFLPFQRQAIDAVSGPVPTAMQALRDAHDTPDRKVPASLGPLCPAHSVPSQCSTSALSAPVDRS